MPRKPDILRIRCEKKTSKDFKKFVIDYEFNDFEEAQKALLKMAELHPEWFKKVEIRNV